MCVSACLKYSDICLQNDMPTNRVFAACLNVLNIGCVQLRECRWRRNMYLFLLFAVGKNDVHGLILNGNPAKCVLHLLCLKPIYDAVQEATIWAPKWFRVPLSWRPRCSGVTRTLVHMNVEGWTEGRSVRRLWSLWWYWCSCLSEFLATGKLNINPFLLILNLPPNTKHGR